MSRKIGMLDLRDEINSILDEYGDKAQDALKQAIEETAEDSVSDLKRLGGFKGRKYRNSWTNEETSTRLNYGQTVFNKRHYRLTHLLEFGHVKQNGGRTRAFPHIADVNNQAEKRVMTRLAFYLER